MPTSARATEPPQLLLLADDLSGAADCTAGALQAGLRTRVTLGSASRPLDPGDAQAWAIDTDTRRLDPAKAATTSRFLLRQGKTGSPLVYKKIDSTLRGHIGVELSAWLPELGVAVVAPSFPAMGRGLLQGRLHVWPAGQNPQEHPVSAAAPQGPDLVQRLTQHGIRTASIPLPVVRSGPEALHQHFAQHLTQGAQAVVCDALLDADLAQIAQASLALRPAPVFWVGSGGLARQLPAAAGLRGPGQSTPIRVKGPLLVAVGSASRVSQEQARSLADHRPLVRIPLDPHVLLKGSDHPQWSSYPHLIARAIAQDKDLLLVLSSAEHHRTPGPEGAARLDGSLAIALATLIQPVMDALGGLITTGGETTRALLSAYGCTHLDVQHEVEPGIPLSLIQTRRAIPLITKAGGFGTPHSLVHCYDHLIEARHTES